MGSRCGARDLRRVRDDQPTEVGDIQDAINSGLLIGAGPPCEILVLRFPGLRVLVAEDDAISQAVAVACWRTPR